MSHHKLRLFKEKQQKNSNTLQLGTAADSLCLPKSWRHFVAVPQRHLSGQGGWEMLIFSGAGPSRSRAGAIPPWGRAVVAMPLPSRGEGTGSCRLRISTSSTSPTRHFSWCLWKGPACTNQAPNRNNIHVLKVMLWVEHSAIFVVKSVSRSWENQLNSLSADGSESQGKYGEWS